MSKKAKDEIIIYKSKEGPKLEVRLQEDTVWLDAHLMAKLFKVDRTVVVKHIRNIYNSDELFENSTCAKIAQVAADGKVRKMNLYNLDMIISVGYRVNSQRATQFRIWATNTLRDHLVKGYTINEKQLLFAQNQLNELRTAIDLYSSLEEKAAHLLYFIIKDHPFIDGNKRVGSIMFIYYLNRNNFLYKNSGEKKINDNTLTTLALLIAVSDPKEKDKMIKIITNLLLQ